MTEIEAQLWLSNIRDLHRNGSDLSSTVNDLIRFLEEYCCPQKTHEALIRMGVWICPECGSRGYAASHVCGDGS